MLEVMGFRGGPSPPVLLKVNTGSSDLLQDTEEPRLYSAKEGGKIDVVASITHTGKSFLMAAARQETTRLQPKEDIMCYDSQDLECPQEINFAGITRCGKSRCKDEAKKIKLSQGMHYDAHPL